MSPHVAGSGKSDRDPTANSETVCPTCNGSGKVKGATCATFGGTGMVTEEVGGA